MTSAVRNDRWSTSVAQTVIPLIIAIVALLASSLTIYDAVNEDRLGRDRADEAELGLSHGRISGALHILYSTKLVADYDAALGRQADEIEQVTVEILSEETRRLRAIEQRSTSHRDTAEKMLDRLRRASADSDMDLDERFFALLDFDSVAPTLDTQQGRAALQLSTGAYLAPAHLAVERAVADGLLADRLDEFALGQDDTILALEDGSAGHMPADVSHTFAGPDQRADKYFPNALRALDIETKRSTDLRPTATWLASFPPFFDGGPSAIDDPPSDLTADIDATTSLFVRIDSALTFHVERAITKDRTDIADDGTRRWGIGIGIGGLVVAMAAFAITGMLRRRRELARLQSTSSLDALTGLADRRAFFERADRRLHREDAPGHVVFQVDLDDFRYINDTAGHAAGDQVLSEVGQRIGLVIEEWEATRGADDVHASRLGNDEFVIALHGVDPTRLDLPAMADQLRVTIGGPVEIDGGLANVRASVGYASTATSEALGELARRSDVALTDAKRRGLDQARDGSDTGTAQWNERAIAERIPSGSTGRESSHQLFLRELIDMTQRHGVELTASNRSSKSDDATTRVHVNLVMEQPDVALLPDPRFAELPPPTGVPAATIAPAVYAQS